MKALALAVPALMLAPPSLAAQSTDPAVVHWKRNFDGNTGRSRRPNIDATVSTIEADVQAVSFDNDYAYIEATGVPSHNVGPFPGNQGIPDDQAGVWRIPRVPVEETGTKTATGLGSTGVFLNGVAIFNASDGRSYQNLGIWDQDAIFFEGGGLDPALGHPAGTRYHYHSRPSELSAQLGENGVDHSPLLGFAFDGFPIYGAYGYDDPTGTGGVVRMDSSWQRRNMIARDTLPDGTVLPPNEHGPAIDTIMPLGAYIQDFEFIAASGHLDEHNGRFCVTPEYPTGTYAYFSTLDANGDLAYPYVIGPTYYGVVDTINLPGGNGAMIPATATSYDPFGIYTYDFQEGLDATIAFGQADPSSTVSIALSLTGNGPYSTPLGDFSLSLPLRRTGLIFADSQGQGAISFPVPASLVGTTYYLQAVSISPGGASATLSNVNNVTFIP